MHILFRVRSIKVRCIFYITRLPAILDKKLTFCLPCICLLLFCFPSLFELCEIWVGVKSRLFSSVMAEEQTSKRFSIFNFVHFFPRSCCACRKRKPVFECPSLQSFSNTAQLGAFMLASFHG